MLPFLEWFRDEDGLRPPRQGVEPPSALESPESTELSASASKSSVSEPDA